MMMITGIGIEVRPPGLNHDLPHDPGIGKLVQGVINRCERNADTGGTRFRVKVFGGNVAVLALKQQFCQGNTLPGRPETSLFQMRNHA